MLASWTLSESIPSDYLIASRNVIPTKINMLWNHMFGVEVGLNPCQETTLKQLWFDDGVVEDNFNRSGQITGRAFKINFS